MRMEIVRASARALAAGALAAAFLAPAAVHADAIRLQAATIAPPDNIWSKAGDRFAAAVKERTKGDVVIAMSYSGALGDAADSIEALNHRRAPSNR